MSEVFADAGYWIAMLDARDRLHERATAAAEMIGDRRIVTTQMVLTEVLDNVTGGHRRRRAWELLQRLDNSPDVEIIPQTDAQFRAAVERYAARSDQRWSLTDCASFLVMEQRGILDALAYDRDFEQAGFAALLRPNRA